jgi:hypothetical protein
VTRSRIVVARRACPTSPLSLLPGHAGQADELSIRTGAWCGCLDMSATPTGPDPLAALPLLAEAGVSVYWQPLDGRTAWVADARTREVWISRAVPRDAVLRTLIQALEFLDETADRSVGRESADTRGPELVHSADRVEQASERTPATLRVVRDA